MVRKVFVSFSFFLLSLALFFSTPLMKTVHADGEISGTCGENLTWTLEDGQLTISGTGEMADYRYTDETGDHLVERPWEDYIDQIVSVTFNEGITYIGSDAFNEYTNLREVHFSDSLRWIGNFAFINCAIEELDLPEELNGLGQQCFGGNPLTEVYVPDNVILLDMPFYGCNQLKYVYIGGKQGTGYTYSDSLFACCSSLETIDVSENNTALMSKNGVLFNKDGTTLLCYPAGRKDETYTVPDGVATIFTGSIDYPAYLKKLILPASLRRIWSYAITSGAGQTNSGITDFVFRGNMPVFDSQAISFSPYFTPNCYYPGSNGTWKNMPLFPSYTHEGTHTTLNWIGYGWKKQADGWTYEDYDGTLLKDCWLYDNNQWYHFDSDGIMQTGWLYADDSWYWLENSGAMVTGWKKINNTWYFFNGSGHMATGWQKIGNVWYYFDASGSMATGWRYVEDTWYYMNSDGAMQTGWQRINGSWYYFSGSGAMQTGWKYINNKWYYLNTSGKMAAGWLYLNNQWYYLEQSGAMVTGTRVINGITYTFSSNGVCLNPNG